MFTTVYGRVQASPGGNGKLVWDVLPARARVATSLRKGDVLRQQSALHAHDVVYLATAASGAMSDGLSMSNLATTVSAGLLLLLGVASVSQQKSPETGTQKVFATAASPSGASGAGGSPSSLNGTSAVAETAKVASTTAASASANVISAREWISAYRVRSESASGSEGASESTRPAIAPSSFVLPGKLITEAERECAEELAEEAGKVKGKVFVSAAASGRVSSANVSNSTEGGSNPFQAFLAWLKALWAAIVKFFSPNSGSGAPASA